TSSPCVDFAGSPFMDGSYDATSPTAHFQRPLSEGDAVPDGEADLEREDRTRERGAVADRRACLLAGQVPEVTSTHDSEHEVVAQEPVGSRLEPGREPFTPN